MSILVDETARVIVQGITGYQGRFHTARMREYGTKIVAGVTPGKGGTEVEGVPVYDSVEEVLAERDANSSIVFVPAPFAKDATLEAIDSDLNPVVIITEGIPIRDSIEIVKCARDKGIHVIGPNTPGIISPGKIKLGIMPSHVFREGNVGIVSRSGTLTYEIAASATAEGLGQSTCIGLGGDPITGMDFVEVLKLFEKDEATSAVVVIGEIGGTSEERAAEFIKRGFSKPVVAFVAGRTAPPGKRMGHAGAIITVKEGTAKSKIDAFKNAGVKVASTPAEVSRILRPMI